MGNEEKKLFLIDSFGYPFIFMIIFLILHENVNLLANILQLQAYFLVLDDIMDSSHTRRGQPCWFRLPKVRLFIFPLPIHSFGAAFQLFTLIP